VAASCAIPGYFAPVTIGGVEYVDGGIHSPTNADVLAKHGLDLVVISSPMSVQPVAARPRVDLSLRLLWHRYVVVEARRLRRAGTPVLVIEPDVATLARLGVNTMRGRHLDVIEERAAAATRAMLRRTGNAAKLALLRPSLDADTG
jgi:NTE family protein